MGRRSTKVQRVCETCGTQFMISPCYVANGGGRYCSTKCSGDAKKKQVDCVCKRCGTLFTVCVSGKALGNGQYCSRKCQSGDRVVLTCGNCGNQFTRVPSKAMAAIQYCSRKCFIDARRKGVLRIEKKCQYCGNIFHTIPARQERSKYCSLKCQHLGQRETVEVKCDYCGKSFTDYPCKIKAGRRFCSNSCCTAANDKRIKSNCKNCGKSFYTSRSYLERGHGLYCSRDCASQANSGSGNKLWRGGGRVNRGPNWRRQRKLARLRDGGVCQRCGRKPKKGDRKFPVHHIKPYREFNGDYLAANDLLNLITLCHRCHPRAEQGIIYVPKRLL